jgi:NitT/TauT family transport system ATP-binding protein
LASRRAACEGIGRIKRVIDIPLESRSREEDLRGTPEFSRLRHEVWSLLRDEFRQAQILEHERVSGAGAAA